MANPNLHLSVINDSASYEARKHAAFKHIEGASSLQEYRAAIRAICTTMAHQEKQKFGTTTTSTDMRRCVDYVCAYMLDHAWEFFNLMPGSKIRAAIRRWFDRANGNSYFSAMVFVHCDDGPTRAFVIPYQYGYGSHPEWTVYNECIKRGIIADPGEHYRYPSSEQFDFEDQGYMQKNRMFGR